MTTVQELLDRLAAIGAMVKPDGDCLILRAGQKPISGELVSGLRWAKSEVLARLNSLDPATSDGCSDVSDVLDEISWRRRFTIRTIHWVLSGWRTRARLRGLPMASCLMNGASRTVEDGRLGNALVVMSRSVDCRCFRSPTNTACTSARNRNA